MQISLSNNALVCSPGVQSLISTPSFIPLPVFHIFLSFSCFSLSTEWSRHTPSPPWNTTPPNTSHQHELCMYVQVSSPSCVSKPKCMCTFHGLWRPYHPVHHTLTPLVCMCVCIVSVMPSPTPQHIPL